MLLQRPLCLSGMQSTSFFLNEVWFDLLIRGMTQTLLEGEEQRRIKGLMCSEQHRWLHLPCDRDTTTREPMFYETPQRNSQSLGGLQAYIIPSRLCMHGM